MGTILFNQEPNTGLLSQKTYFDRSGQKIRQESYSYDEMGRLTHKKQKTFSGACGSKVDAQYFYFYDGRLPNRRHIPGQLGSLSAVQGPDYFKEMTYGNDGQITHSELKVQNGPRVKTDFTYRADGVLQEKKIQVDGQGTLRQNLASRSRIPLVSTRG